MATGTIKNPIPVDVTNLVRIHNEQAVDFNVVFRSSDCRGIHLYFYTQNSSYKPDDKGGFALQYCWSTGAGIQLAFTGNADMYIRWNWAGIGQWRKFAYA